MKISSPRGHRPVGARYLGAVGCQFRVWAPFAEAVEVVLTAPRRGVVPMKRQKGGYYSALVAEAKPGSRYVYRLDQKEERPDPASVSQPEGVHAPSEVIDPAFDWQDAGWFGLPLRDYVLYELHVGTFTAEGTFDAVIPHLAELKELGITAIELMPVAQFPGSRNWGYDGVYPFAVQNSYGGPAGLKRLVNAAHQHGLAVILDVVYNHLGPEGNYLDAYGPYFTDRYHLPWGRALNFDGPESDEVRCYFVENALYWQTDFHIDALRLDAIHAICDLSAVTFLEDLAEATRRQSDRLNRRFHLIAESDLNDPRVILPPSLGGFGIDAQWSDDFHHALHVLLTGEQQGYYADFGGISIFAHVLRDGFAYVNQYSVHRRRRHGRSPPLASLKQFVVYSQNHDQVGNRANGDRLSQLVSFERHKLAAGAVILSPFVPLLFMGEEYGESAPFQYFTSHSDPQLAEAVRQGRRREFAAFHAAELVPDPQDPATFTRSKLNRALSQTATSRVLREYYRELLVWRRALQPIALADRESVQVMELPGYQSLCLRYAGEGEEVRVVLCFSAQPVEVETALPPGPWSKRLDSSDARWNGPGSSVPEQFTAEGSVRLTLAPFSCLLLHQLSSCDL